MNTLRPCTRCQRWFLPQERGEWLCQSCLAECNSRVVMFWFIAFILGVLGWLVWLMAK